MRVGCANHVHGGPASKCCGQGAPSCARFEAGNRAHLARSTPPARNTDGFSIAWMQALVDSAVEAVQAILHAAKKCNVLRVCLTSSMEGARGVRATSKRSDRQHPPRRRTADCFRHPRPGIPYTVRGCRGTDDLALSEKMGSLGCKVALLRLRLFVRGPRTAYNIWGTESGTCFLNACDHRTQSTDLSDATKREFRASAQAMVLAKSAVDLRAPSLTLLAAEARDGNPSVLWICV